MSSMKVKIVHVLCEGQTEQGFVEAVLRPYLQAHGITGIKSVLLTTNKKQNTRGGMLSYIQVKTDVDLLLHIHQDSDYESHVFTTMFDYYALPNDFPGYADAVTIHDPYLRVESLENYFKTDIKDSRFIPYIQLHEFEALLFCGIDHLKQLYPNSIKGCQQLSRDLVHTGNPELIDDGLNTAPSKRIIRAIEGERHTLYRYNKPATGKAVTKEIGIDTLRSKCPHFDKWIQNLIDTVRNVIP